MNETIRAAIMQPYFLPYIGYWQLMHNVDIFVVYDNIEYTKKGWINRNRFLLNNNPEIFTLPLKKDSDFLYICQRHLSENFDIEKEKLIRRLEAVYSKAPFFKDGQSLLVDIFSCKERNLFNFIYRSIENIYFRLGMKSQLIVSSTLDIPHQLRGQDRVIATCKQLGATDYINPIGGIDLYDRAIFKRNNINLFFQKVRAHQYLQLSEDFVPNLSIIDQVMMIGIEGVLSMLIEMDLC